MFHEKGYDSHFLENLIRKMESEDIIVLCRVHHQIEHSKYFNHFKHLINWQNIPYKFPQNIFSLPTELIHILIRLSVENYYITAKSSKEKKRYARESIIAFLRKKYIIDIVYKGKCPSCGEFNTIDHLPSFAFCHISKHHFHENPYVRNEHRHYIKSASHLYNHSYTCSEIARALDFEEGGYTCKNCHKVLDYSSLRLKVSNEIYDDKTLVEEILTDYDRTKTRFKLFRFVTSIGNPLKKIMRTKGYLEKYLDAIYKITQEGRVITHKALADHLGLKQHTIFQFLKRRESFFRYFINIDVGKGHGHDPTIITLTNKGKTYIELIYYFKEYYKNHLKNSIGVI